MIYDLAVVGAGPAGSNAARIAAKKGLSVIVLDKRQEIGSPVRCGEGLNIEFFLKEKLPLDNRFIANYIDTAEFYSPDNTVITVKGTENAGAIVERKIFDKFLANLAVSEGSELYIKSEVKNITRDKDIYILKISESGAMSRVKARCVIIAEGVEGRLASKIGFESKNKLKNIFSGFQYEICGLNIDNPSTIKFFIDESITPQGYAWVFPKGDDRANVGVIARGSSNIYAQKSLNLFLNKYPELRGKGYLEANSGTIPVSEPLNTLVIDKILIAGDCAHQVNPIHAGGICEGMIGGRLAAESVVRYINAGEENTAILKEYEKNWIDSYGHLQKKLMAVRYFLDILSNEDYNFIFRKLNGEDIAKIVSGEKISFLLKLISGRPSLLKKALKTLKNVV